VKINIVIPSFYPAVVYGGPIFSSLHTSQELSKLNDIEVYVSTTNTNMYDKLDVETNKWIEFDNNLFVKYYNEIFIDKFSLQLYLNLWRDIKKSDVVNMQAIFNTPVPIALLYAKIFNKPVLLSPRGALCEWGLAQGNKYKTYWLNLFIRPFKKRIFWHATCQDEKEDILNIFPNAKVNIISNGVDVESYNKYNILTKEEYLNKYLNITEKTCSHIVVSMSRLHAKKGFDILIHSFNEVLKKYPNSILLIAGPDEGEEENLKNLIIRLGLVKSIYLVGSISKQEKIDFLANADLFVLPSHNENFGNVYIESLASGTPIIASKGTPWEEVESFDCGKWVNNNVDETSRAMLQMFSKDRKLMRINSKKLAKKYDWKNIALQFKNLYERINKK
jgi:glycosyltransferase involved in cell wall biosynthesis